MLGPLFANDLVSAIIEAHDSFEGVLAQARAVHVSIVCVVVACVMWGSA